MSVKHYQELVVWQKAMDLVVLVYRHSANFPRQEIFGLTNQVRRAAVSVPSNIAEGQGRNTTREFLHFLGVARGSLQEVETQVLIAGRLNYLDALKQAELTGMTSEVGRLLSGLCSSLQAKL